MSVPSLQSTTPEFVIDDLALETVSGFPLFYPSSGLDLDTPARMFGTVCRDLHFADVAYFGNRLVAAGKQKLAIGPDARWLESNERLVEIPRSEWESDRKYRGIQPRVRSHNYVDIATGINFRIHLHRRRGPTAMRRELDKMGVFFYRRDSDEGGSATKWLTIDRWPKTRKRRWLIFEVLEKLVDGGLIVTDGSMCVGSRNPYRYFRELIPQRPQPAAALWASTPTFSDGLGRNFRCVGAIHDQRGNALIWQVTHS